MSHFPLAHKVAVVKTLCSRVGVICSDVIAKDQETRHIRQAFINNYYMMTGVGRCSTTRHQLA